MNIYNSLREAPPSPAAAQAWFDLKGEVPEDGPAPASALAHARRSVGAAAHVARSSSGVSVLTHLAQSDSRVRVRLALLENPALPYSEVAPLVEWFLDRPRQNYESLSGPALAAAAEKVPGGPPPGLRCAAALRAAEGCLHAASALEKHLVSAYDVMRVRNVDPMVVQACHDEGLHTIAALLYDRMLHEVAYTGAYTRGKSEAVVRAGLGSLLLADDRARYVPSVDGFVVDIPDDLLPDIIKSHAEFAVRTVRDLPEDLVVAHASALLGHGWVRSGRWSTPEHWTPAIWGAVASAVAAEDPGASLLPATFDDLLSGCTSSMPGVESHPLTLWVGGWRNPHSLRVEGYRHRTDITCWWLKYSAGRPRTVGEAVNLIHAAHAAEYGEVRIAQLAETLLVDCRDMWTDDEVARIEVALEASGDYSRSLTYGLDLVGPASILGDNVEAWKLFYSLSEDNPDSPMQTARTAVALAGG